MNTMEKIKKVEEDLKILKDKIKKKKKELSGLEQALQEEEKEKRIQENELFVSKIEERIGEKNSPSMQEKILEVLNESLEQKKNSGVSFLEAKTKLWEAGNFSIPEKNDE